jgi:hypothetical protein
VKAGWNVGTGIYCLLQHGYGKSLLGIWVSGCKEMAGKGSCYALDIFLKVKKQQVSQGSFRKCALFMKLHLDKTKG